jgi:hypothetical protein
MSINVLKVEVTTTGLRSFSIVRKFVRTSSGSGPSMQPVTSLDTCSDPTAVQRHFAEWEYLIFVGLYAVFFVCFVFFFFFFGG